MSPVSQADPDSHEPNGASAGATSSPERALQTARKRRKVNLACIYCRRSHMTCDQQRPCTRCLKRDIGHLCHDEPPKSQKKADSEYEGAPSQLEAVLPSTRFPPSTSPKPLPLPPAADQRVEQIRSAPHGAAASLHSPSLPYPRPPRISESILSPIAQAPNPAPVSPQFVDYNKWSLGAQNQFQDMHTFDPFIFNSPQVTEEYNLLNTFLKETSLLDEEAVFLRDDNRDPNDGGDAIDPFPAHHLKDGVSPAAPNPDPNRHLLPAPIDLGPENVISRPASVKPTDDARETYYLTAADPSGSDPPEERMKKLLRAKYEAGLLKPFNYLKGYARLSRYMERNMRAPSRQKILRQLDKFRPIFRERMQALTDMELVLVEMWFERSLMEYDRVFASMAIPACCWRRTGEIYRGNKEMAELIHAPIEQLRDGKVAIHEVFEEDSLVGYWEKFGTIAFDKAQKAMLTSCMLKSPDPKSTARHIHCCFSFTIRRDSHDIPSLIVGNFLPMDIP